MLVHPFIGWSFPSAAHHHHPHPRKKLIHRYRFLAIKGKKEFLVHQVQKLGHWKPETVVSIRLKKQTLLVHQRGPTGAEIGTLETWQASD